MLNTIHALWAHLLRKVKSHDALEHIVHKGQHSAHMAYLGLVAIESHGYYGKAALVLLILGVVAHFAGIDGGE